MCHVNIVQEKQNEISALKPLLTPALVKGRIVTVDAMHTQRELCAQVHRWGGAYILIARDNQPTLAQDWKCAMWPDKLATSMLILSKPCNSCSTTHCPVF